MTTVVAVTSTAHNPLAPSWDEAIVPTLRKRLESESRMLTQRLSTISGGSADDAKQQPQLQEEEPPNDTRPPASSSSSRRTPNGTRSHTPTNTSHLQRPSAIPRPSFSRAGERPNTPATRSNTAAPPEPSSSHENQSTTAVPARKRTQSTPFPFDPPPDLPTSSVTNGKQSTSSSNSSSGTAKSNGGRTTPTPSRIPTVPSRIRSGSQSSQALNTIGKSVGAKVAPSESNSTYISESPSALTPAPSSSASTSASRHRASEDHQGYRANKQSHAGIEESVNERLSSDEEKPFQHWYRGDVSRNGGVGEYRVGKREEMLDIASFGHKPPSKSRQGSQDGRGLPTIFNDRSLRKRAESISSVERTSLYMENPDETITGRILDESPLEDAEFNSVNGRPRRQSIASMERISLYMAPVEGSDGVPSSETKSNTMNFDSQNPTPLPEPKNNKHPVLGSSVVPGKYPPLRTRNVSNPRHESKASTSTTSSLPETLASRKPTRGRAQSPVERSKTPQKRVDQKRSKSVADAIPHPKPPDDADLSGLTPDAIPDTRTPIPIDGNWDEMVLPTVARRMGIEYEKKDSTTKSQEPLVAPAPGTFGFDYSKYRPWRPSEEAIPMSEFGLRSPSPPPTGPEEQPRWQEQPTQQERSFSQPTFEVPIEKPPEAISQMRPRRDTLPPFAHYAGTQLPKERHDMPQVVIHQQDMGAAPRAAVYVEEGEETRCCKCIIM